MKQLVGIVLLNWNGWRDTVSCLTSIGKITKNNFFIVVVDNFSSDDSVSQIVSLFPDIKIIVNDKNRGFGGGCNPGIKYCIESGADYVWLLNTDTTVFDDSLDQLLARLSGDSAAGAAGSVLRYMDDPTKLQAWGGGYVSSITGVSRHLNVAPTDNSRLHYLTAASMLVRSEVFQAVGYFDEDFFMYWEDVDLGFRIRKAGWKLAVAENSIVLHKESASLGKASPILTRYLNESAVKFFRKHYEWWLLPVAIGLAGRLLKKILKRDWAGCVALLSVVFKK